MNKTFISISVYWTFWTLLLSHSYFFSPQASTLHNPNFQSLSSYGTNEKPSIILVNLCCTFSFVVKCYDFNGNCGTTLGNLLDFSLPTPFVLKTGSSNVGKRQEFLIEFLISGRQMDRHRQLTHICLPLKMVQQKLVTDGRLVFYNVSATFFESQRSCDMIVTTTWQLDECSIHWLLASKARSHAYDKI